MSITITSITVNLCEDAFFGTDDLTGVDRWASYAAYSEAYAAALRENYPGTEITITEPANRYCTSIVIEWAGDVSDDDGVSHMMMAVDNQTRAAIQADGEYIWERGDWWRFTD